MPMLSSVVLLTLEFAFISPMKQTLGALGSDVMETEGP